MNYIFTDRLQRTLIAARREALRRKHASVGTEHLLFSVLHPDEGVGAAILNCLGVSCKDVVKALEVRLAPPELDRFPLPGDVPLSAEAKRSLEYAMAEARGFGHSYVGTEHLLLGLLREAGGVAAEILRAHGVTLDLVRREIATFLGPMSVSMASAPQAITGSSSSFEDSRLSGSNGRPFSPFEDYCTDLVALAKDGRLDPVLGREREIDRVIEILCRRRKNNPVLVGEAGAGKTAIMEGLAQRIAAGLVPPTLKDARVLLVDLGSVLAGTRYRGQFEERLLKIIQEACSNDRIILAIDELHTIVGTGAAEGSLDAANLLKPALARGELRLIGATTLDEYQRYIERDRALERRFQLVLVDPPSEDVAIEILRGLAPVYAGYHGVDFDDAAIVDAVRLSARYIPHRHLPDKAIDLLDEAAAHVRAHFVSASVSGPWVEGTRTTGASDRERIRLGAQDGGALPRCLLNTDAGSESFMASKNFEEPVSRPVVDARAVAEVVGRLTGIPVARLTMDERQRLSILEDRLQARIVGQEEALSAVSRAIRQARVLPLRRGRPIGAFLFCGPSGVGKTETARVLAEIMFEHPDALVRIDMSEYMEKHSVSRLIGAAPGYAGCENVGFLARAIRQRPYCVLLFDEIEKAHPDVLSLLLQILGDGHLTDNYGRRIDFKNTIVILTSNIGARVYAKDGRPLGFSVGEDVQQTSRLHAHVLEEIKRAFSPEFLNRLDDIIVFRPFDASSALRLTTLAVANLRRELRDYGVELEVSEEALRLVAERGYDREYGARSIARAVEREIKDRVAHLLLHNDLEAITEIQIGVNKTGQLEVRACGTESLVSV